MTTILDGRAGVPPARRQPQQFADLPWCRWCALPLAVMILPGDRRVYDCASGCRPTPIDAAWLEAEILRALPPRIRLYHAHTVIDRVTVGVQLPTDVRLTWHVQSVGSMRQPQERPSVTFVPVAGGH